MLFRSVAPLDLGVEGGEESMLFQRPKLLEIGGKAGTLMREAKKEDARQRDRFRRDNAWVKCLRRRRKRCAMVRGVSVRG